MNKGIKLFGQHKETKELERNSVNLRRVRDFVARYSDPDDLSFSGSEQNKKSASEAAQTFSFVTENYKEEQAKKTRKKGNTLSLTRSRASTTLTKTSLPTDSALTDSFQDEFPLIELPATNEDGHGESSATTPTTEQDFIPADNSSVIFTSPSAAPIEESEHEEELPLIQPIELDTREEEAASAKETFLRESNAAAVFEEAKQEETFTLGDDVAATIEKPRGVRTASLREKTISLRGRNTELTLTPVLTREETPKIEPAVASEDSFQKKPSSFFQRARRRRIKRTHVYIGRHKTVATRDTAGNIFSRSAEDETLNSSVSTPPIVAFAETDLGASAETGVSSEDHLCSDRSEQTTALGIEPQRSSAVPKDVEKPLAVQRELDSLDPCLVSFLAPDSFEAEQYRVLRHLVERLKAKCGRSCIVAVSSPSAGDGKTTTSLNLAGALAQAADARVLLIEADLRRPAVLERLGGQPAAGRGLVKAVLHPRLRLQNTTMHYAFLNLTILPAGHLTSSSYEIFKSPRFGALLEEAQREYDYIILDTPPLVPIPDCRLIAQWVDGFFVVVAAHKTPRRLVQEALAVIPDEKVLGLVFNGDDPPVFGYEQYYGYSPLQATEKYNRESLS